MSLTNILDYSVKEFKGFRSFLSENFTKPRVECSEPLLTPSLAVNPSLIGTAFDYLLRFHLEKRFNNKVISGRWVSENAIAGYFKRKGLAFQSFGVYEDLNFNAIKRLSAIKEKAPKKFLWCKDVYAKFLKSKNAPSQLYEACLFLAKLDNIYRRGLPTLDELSQLFDVRERDIAELESLIFNCNLDLFTPRTHIILNPGFATNIVPADADLVVDDMLIEIKVTKHLKLSREHFNQLIGYYLLYRIGGIAEKKKVRIKKLAVYFARHNFLWQVNVSEIGTDLIFKEACTELKRCLKEHPL